MTYLDMNMSGNRLAYLRSDWLETKCKWKRIRPKFWTNTGRFPSLFFNWRYRGNLLWSSFNPRIMEWLRPWALFGADLSAHARLDRAWAVWACAFVCYGPGFHVFILCRYWLWNQRGRQYHWLYYQHKPLDIPVAIIIYFCIHLRGLVLALVLS
jgi:hypothetical protein